MEEVAAVEIPRDEQIPLFEVKPDWEETWGGMPGFTQKDLEPWKSVLVHFKNREDMAKFAEAINQNVYPTTRSLWFPPAEIGHMVDRRFKTPDPVTPRYPIYIISKGRWESRLTSKALEKIGVPYSIVVEPQEYDNYAEVIDPEKILVLPFSNLGQGSIPARNWVWEHSIGIGAERHWILDDNISGFYRLHNNLKTPVASGATFLACEDFTDRYENVVMSGMNYFMFAPRKSGAIRPYTLNTRIYSCILLRNDLPHRWRGRYNEDTDLSIRFLKDGYCTILFNAFLAFKETTMTMKGGNEELYRPEINGRWLMAKSLQDQHPDIVKITQKWGRYQHHVDYRGFRINKLVPKAGVEIPEEENPYGMELEIDGQEEEEEIWEDENEPNSEAIEI